MFSVLQQYGLPENSCVLQPLGNGLINTTWLVKTEDETYVLQQINHHIFKTPEDIAFNIRLISDHLKLHHPDYLFTAALQTMDGKDLVKTTEGFFRMFPFVKDSHTIDVVEKPEQAYEAASQFARFTKLLTGLNASLLRITLPGFHDLSLRYRQFETALETGNKKRINDSQGLIIFIEQQQHLVTEYEYCKLNFETRCTHHDTKDQQCAL